MSTLKLRYCGMIAEEIERSFLRRSFSSALNAHYSRRQKENGIWFIGADSSTIDIPACLMCGSSNVCRYAYINGKSSGSFELELQINLAWEVTVCEISLLCLVVNDWPRYSGELHLNFQGNW